MILKNGKQIVIRKAEKSDAQAMLDYLKMISTESDNILMTPERVANITLDQEEKIIEDMNSSEDNALFVGLLDGKIISTAGVYTNNNPRRSHQSGLAISVLKEFWGVGVGTAMMREMINFAKKNGKIMVHLGVKEDNLGGIALYKKMGFTKYGVHPKFFNLDGKYFDEILMYLEI